MMTGLVFARISRPRARLIFARYPVIAAHNGVPTLMFRIANARSNFITEATAKMWMIGPTVSQEGRRLVGFQPLRLVKSENPTLALSWTLFHPIDADSPLFGLDEETLIASEIEFRRQHHRLRRNLGADGACARTFSPRRTFVSGHEYVDIIYERRERACATSTTAESTRPVQLRTKSKRWLPFGNTTKLATGCTPV